MKHFLRFFIVLLLLSTANAASRAGTLYKSVGPDGKIDYSDRPPTEGRIEKTFQFENLPSSAVPDLSHSYVEQLRRLRASQPASVPSTGRVVLYGASWCGYCKSARAYLGNKGIAYQEIDIDSPKGKEAFAQVGGGGVPLLLAENRRVQGYTLDAYEAFFARLKPPAKPASR